MVQIHDVRQAIEQYLSDQCSLRVFASWLAQAGWDLRAHEPDALAMDAIRDLELHLAEYTSNGCTREALQRRFRAVLATLPETVWSTNATDRDVSRSSAFARTELSEALV
jgi:hypothetical protein